MNVLSSNILEPKVIRPAGYDHLYNEIVRACGAKLISGEDIDAEQGKIARLWRDTVADALITGRLKSYADVPGTGLRSLPEGAWSPLPVNPPGKITIPGSNDLPPVEPLLRKGDLKLLIAGPIEPVWNLDQALLWIATRDLGHVDRASSRWRDRPFTWSLFVGGSENTMDTEEPLVPLVDALAGGRIVALSEDGGAINGFRFRTAVLVYDGFDGANAQRAYFKDEPIAVNFEGGRIDPLFKSADVVGLWSADAAEIKQPSGIPQAWPAAGEPVPSSRDYHGSKDQQLVRIEPDAVPPAVSAGENDGRSITDYDRTESSYRTGLPGRPSSKHLCLAEARRRIASEDLGDSRAKFCDNLSEWLKAEHPLAAPITAKTLSNDAELRSLYLRGKSTAA